MFSGAKVHAEEGLGRQVRHRDQEVRVLQRDREEGPARARQEVRDHGRRHPRGQRLRGARRAGVRAALRAAQAPRQPRRVSVHLHRLQVAPEPRGPLGEPPLVPGVQEGRPGRRVVGRRAEDEPGRRREAGPEDRRHGEDHLAGRRRWSPSSSCGRACARAPSRSATARATGPTAASRRRTTPRRLPRGGNNNDILVDDYDRLSGATARNGGFTGVRVQKA